MPKDNRTNTSLQAADAVDNATFLKAVFRDDLWRAHVTGFREDPSTLDTSGLRHYWAGTIWENEHIQNWVGPRRNGFFTISVFKEDPVLGQHRRRKANFDRCFCVVFDDVCPEGKTPGDGNSAKVSLDKIKLDPSWVLETSPDNYQMGFILVDGDDRDGDARDGKVTALLNALVDTGLVSDGTDPGMKGVTRYVRLPVGSNTKAKYLEKHPEGFAHVLREWQPERQYTLEQIADAHGLREELDAAPDHVMAGTGSVVVDADTDWQLDALSRAGLVHGERTGAGGQTLWDVTCPFVETHTDRADSGTVYLGGGRWDCRHKCSEWCDHDTPEYWRFDEKLEADFPEECRAAKLKAFDDGVDYGDAGTAPGNLDALTLEQGEDLFDGFGFETVHAEEAEKRELGPFQEARKNTLDLNEILQKGPILETAWLCKGVIPPEGVGVAYGDGAVGKTATMLDMCLKLVTGRAWHGRKWKRDGSVFYLMSEGGDVSRVNRTAAWEQHCGTLTFDQRRRILIDPSHMLLAAGADGEEEIKNFIRWARREIRNRKIPKLDMIVIDTLSQNMSGDENSATDIAAVLQRCKHISRSLNCFVWVLHHVGKDETKGARGSKAISQNADVVLALSRTKGDPIGKIFVEKVRDGADAYALGYEMIVVRLGTDSDGDPVESIVVVEAAPPSQTQTVGKEEAHFLETLETATDFSDDPLGTADLEDVISRASASSEKNTGFHKSPSVYRKKVDRLKEKGLIEVDKDRNIISRTGKSYKKQA